MINQITDLSKEFHPYPKPTPKSKKAPRKLGPGKKTDAWTDARETIKKQFTAWGITSCELKLDGCWKNNALGFAHLDKRRNLTKDDLPKVVLCCNPCHEQIEYIGRKEMRELLEKIIEARTV